MAVPTRFDRRTIVRAAAAGAAMVWTGGCSAVRPTRCVTVAQPPPPPDPGTWETLADLALAEVRRGGASYGDIRVLRTTEETIRGEDGRVESVMERHDGGFGVRALHGGAWGFAASALLEPEEVRRVARLAVAIARASSTLTNDPVKLAKEPVHVDAVRTVREVDPFALPLEEKTELILGVMDAMQAAEGIKRSAARLWAQRDEKLFASTEGSRIRFDLLAVNGNMRATAVHEGAFASRSFTTPYLRRGFEVVREGDLLGEAPRVARQAVEKAKSPVVKPGAYDLVLDPAHLALTIHETCGHPTELDRALGYEANYAGTSFLTPEKLGSFRYGSEHVSLVADNTEPETLAATGYDDDGVAGQRWDIVRDGVFIGYSTNREVAPKIGEKRSRGSNRADSWASIPIVRISNIGLEPKEGTLDDLLGDVKRGIYIEGRGSFSIDQRRYNFQFGGDAFWLVENGKRKHMLRDVIYHGITPEFWGACDAVAGKDARRRFGFITCGKGQPGQSGWMTHAASPARFRGIDVLAGRTGA